MSSDTRPIDDRLTEWADERNATKKGVGLAYEAAAEIKRLRAELAALTAAKKVMGKAGRPRWEMDVSLDFGDQLFELCGMLEDFDDPSPIRLRVGDGHSGYGLYVSSLDPQPGVSVKLHDLSAPAAEEWPAAGG